MEYSERRIRRKTMKKVLFSQKKETFRRRSFRSFVLCLCMGILSDTPQNMKWVAPSLIACEAKNEAKKRKYRRFKLSVEVFFLREILSFFIISISVKNAFKVYIFLISSEITLKLNLFLDCICDSHPLCPRPRVSAIGCSTGHLACIPFSSHPYSHPTPRNILIFIEDNKFFFIVIWNIVLINFFNFKLFPNGLVGGWNGWQMR